MAIIEGRPATDFSDMNRKYIREVAEEIAGSNGLPDVSSSDNGDVLTVVEGAWAKAAPAAELPAVTSSDNGDVLTVVEGAWAKAAPSSGAPITILTPVCNYVSSPGGIKMTFQESFDEIVTLAQSGLVFIKFYVSGEGYAENFIGYIYDIYQSTEDDVTTTEIKAWQPDSTSFESNAFEIYVDNNETVAVLAYTG